MSTVLPNDSATEMRRRFTGSCFAIAVVWCCALGVSAAYAEESPMELRIGSIEIVSDDVFSVNEAGHGRAYMMTNSLHVMTRESVIRKFLLFEEGGIYLPPELAESERILRALHFLSTASVTPSEPHDGVVDVVVYTQDAWSTQPGGTVGSAGGQTDFSFAIEENNFLGFGKQVTLYYASDVERTGLGVRYEDPAFLSSRWRADLLYANNSDGTQTEIGIERPFYAFSTPWAVSAGVADRQFTSRTYANGAVAGEFNQSHKALQGSYGLALTPDNVRAHRISFGLDWQVDEFLPLAIGASTPVPTDRDYRYLFVDYELARNDFAKVNYLNRDQRFEDLRIGARLSLRAGVSPTFFGVDRTTGMVEAAVSRGFEIGPAIVLAGVSLQSRVGADNSNRTANADLRVIQQYDSLDHPQTTVARLSINHGQDLDSDTQFFADGSTGLRGYRLYSFAGDSSIVMNLEHRIFLGRELWQFLSPGVAFFVDAGNAGYGTAAFKPGNLKFDAGIGLRLGLTRTSSRTFRLDFAYAFDPDPFGQRGWLASFSGGQAF